jgi:hypothetical protein
MRIFGCSATCPQWRSSPLRACDGGLIARERFTTPLFADGVTRRLRPAFRSLDVASALLHSRVITSGASDPSSLGAFANSGPARNGGAFLLNGRTGD